MAEYKLSYTAAQIDGKLKKIDTLAAKSDIPTATSDLTNDSGFATETYVQEKLDAKVQVQGDWEQTDETDAGFIKNKPEIATDDEILEMLMQEDMLPVVADSDGLLLADEHDNILLW